MKKTLLIDTNNILNRSFYGIPPLTAADGRHTNAVYGMLGTLLPILEQGDFHFVAACFDLSAPTHRHRAYQDYKATRSKMPDELREQMPLAKEVLRAMGIAVVELEGYEADDIMGTLATRAASEGGHAFILSGDRDGLQLVSEGVSAMLISKGDTATMTPADVTAKYGVTPAQLLSVKALMGDASDNIPGVAGVGEKTALKLISQYGDLDGVYANLDDKGISAGLRAKLEGGRDDAYLSLELGRIMCDVPLGFELADIALQPHGEALPALLRELNFTSLLKRMDVTAPKKQAVREVSLDQLIAAKSNAPLFFHLEDTTITILTDDGVLCAEYTDLGELAPLWQGAVCTFDSKPFYRRLLASGVEISLVDMFDIKLTAYALSAVANGEYSPANVASVAGQSMDGEDDVAVLYDLFTYYKDRMLDEDNPLAMELEIPAAKTLARMEHAGFALDSAGLRAYGVELAGKLTALQSEVHALAGEEFNLNSPKQLGEILYGRLGLPPLKKTKTGASTDAETLQKLAPYHPIIPCILEYRHLAKLHSTYCEGLLSAVTSAGLVHTTFKQTGTATGRLSSVEPNLQNIPVRTEAGRQLRRYFVPRDTGRVLICADYSQIELRLLAHLCGDENMLSAFAEGVDIHTLTASLVFDTPLPFVTEDMRKRAKAVNFGIIYGMGDFGLATDLGITRKEAAKFIQGYMESYPKIAAYMEQTIAEGTERGYVSTLMGRRRYIPELTSKKATIRNLGERIAKNSPLQGSAADIIKAAMIAVERQLATANLDAFLVMQVHDELIVDCAAKDADAVAEILRREMEQAGEGLAVPLLVDVSIGESWG